MKTLRLLSCFAFVFLGTNASSGGPTNDFFANSRRMEGTNFSFIGELAGATLEAGEPYPGAYSNTIWMSWAPPATGRGRYTRRVVVWSLPIKVYTGSTLESLTPVKLIELPNRVVDFVAEQGKVYHFQISGQDATVDLPVRLLPWTMPPNDQFENASQMAGQSVGIGPDLEKFWIGEATREIGEPEHLDGIPFKSLWWKWTAPVHGTAHLNPTTGFATNVTIAAYEGNSVAALTLLAKGKTNVSWPVTGGREYRVAAVVTTNTPGDIVMAGEVWQQSGSRIIPGNLLREPSWEGTAIYEAQYWGWSSTGVGGAVWEPGGCDGITWPTLGNSAYVWQDIATVPGREYSIRFAMRANNDLVGTGNGDGRVRVLWDDEEAGMGIMPEAWYRFWNWAHITAMATSTTTRVTFLNIGRNIELDAFSIVAEADPPQIVADPTSATAISGGSAAFVVGATGSDPLTYHWSFNGAPHSVSETPVLVLDPVSTNDSGTYQVIVSNAHGSAVSAPATLTIEAPSQPVILWQPYGDTVGVGGYFNLGVIAVGTPPLLYQWHKDGLPIPGATNSALTFQSVNDTNAGAYAVQVQNDAGRVWSLAASLVVTNAVSGGGIVNFANQAPLPSLVNAPVFDIDTVTRLSGSNYVAQLYGGPSLALIRPVGEPRSFDSGFEAGYWWPQTVILPTVAPGSNAVLQVRAWDRTRGNTYEEARFVGGKFGKSEMFTITVGGGLTLPADLEGLQSFSLQIGLPEFTRGQIAFVERKPDGTVVWSHYGQAGSQYVIEKSFLGFDWHPYVVITNVGSSAIFTDSANSASAVIFYRSRILD